jgi:hypothetical protein
MFGLSAFNIWLETLTERTNVNIEDGRLDVCVVPLAMMALVHTYSTPMNNKPPV